MDWLRINRNLPQHPKSKALARALGEAVSWWRIAQVWAWCLEYARDGRIEGDGADIDIEDAAGWPEARRGEFVDACVRVGFIEKRDGALIVHDWDEHNGAAIKLAEKAAARSRKWRRDKQKERDRANAKRTHTVREPNSNSTGNQTRHNQTRPDEVERQQQQSAAVAPPEIPPPEKRITGAQLRELWNQAAAPPAKLPQWDSFPTAQELQADQVALEFDRDTWTRAFRCIRASAFLNGFGPKGFVLTPRKLLAQARHFVDGALNGEYAGPNDLREAQAPAATAIASEEPFA